MFFHLLDSSIVRCTHHPSEPTHLCTRRLRPLHCGYVSRARRHTGTIISSLSISFRFRPRTFQSSGLYTHPKSRHWSCICLLDTIFYVLTIRPLHSSLPFVDEAHRLITVVSRPPPLCIHTHPPRLHFPPLLSPTTYPARLVSRGTTMSALDIACLQEHAQPGRHSLLTLGRSGLGARSCGCASPQHECLMPAPTPHRSHATASRLPPLA